MNFQDLISIGDHKFYLDVAFNKAKKKGNEARSTLKKHDRLNKAIEIEKKKIESINESIKNSFKKIEESFPSFDSLPEFYQELCKLYFDIRILKKSLASLRWVMDKVNELSKKNISNLKKCKSISNASSIRRAHYGRVSSVLKQINKNLIFLEECRKKMKRFPAIKEKLFTIAIVGFPNVGKSTLISSLTFSNVAINHYAFTTKRLLVGYSRIRHEKIQFIDTPGTLNRENKMNEVEKHADLAIKYLADVLVYIFDPTEEYPLEKQEKLLKNVKKFHKPTILYMSKTDIADEQIIEEIKSKHKKIYTDKENLMDEIEKEFLRF